MMEEFSMADYLAWKEFMRTNANTLPLAGTENDEKDLGTNQEDVKVLEQPKVKVNLAVGTNPHKSVLRTLILLDSCFPRL